MQAGDVEVDAFDANNQVILAKGKALLIDNVADTATGTITLKATFPNDDEALWPGQFVNARLLLETQKGALTIPTAAVQRGPEGLYAWTVASDGRASMHPLQAGPDDGNFTVVTSGLASGDRIVTGGQSRLQDGAAVTIAPDAVAADGTAAAVAQ